jgi:hypothetical protein
VQVATSAKQSHPCNAGKLKQISVPCSSGTSFPLLQNFLSLAATSLAAELAAESTFITVQLPDEIAAAAI